MRVSRVSQSRTFTGTDLRIVSFSAGGFFLGFAFGHGAALGVSCPKNVR
jgi:hypothetical protein